MNETPVAPRFYTADHAHGLVVLEDLDQGQGLGPPLLGSDASEAEAALVQIAELLGRMHSRTVGKRAEFDRLRDSLAPRQKDAAYETYEWLSNGIREAARALEVPLVPGTEADLSTVIATIRDPGPFLAYTHGDPCPDNFLKTHDQIKLIDYEFGDFRHALTDGVYGRIHFPTCWCVNRIPPLIVERMEVAYRTALAEGCPAARNDMLFERAVVIGCAYWVCTMFDWYRVPALLDSPIQWGTATVQQRVLLRADIFANLTMQRGYLQALGATVGELAIKLRAQLPREAHTMPFYPPFRS
jgi:hypothetical protein